MIFRMFRFSQVVLSLIVVLLVKLTSCDSNARIQSTLTAPDPPRHFSSHPAHDKPSRRTFVTAILAAEVAYLESLLSKQNQKKKQKPKHLKSVSNNHIHRPKKVRAQAPKPTPAYNKPVATTTKYVAKLDPFYMITAPDLSVKSESHKPAPVTELAPLPTYGAYQEYKATPSVPPKTTTVKPSTTTTYKPATTTTLKYGDFELYQPKGYLPPTPPKKVADPPSYVAPKKEEPKPVTYRPSHSYLPPTNKKPKTTKPKYKPSKGYLPPVKQSKPSYEPPASPPKYQPPASLPKYEPPASPPKYKPPPPSTYRPSKGYLPPVKQQKPSYKAPKPIDEAPKSEEPGSKAPKYEAPVPAPKYEAPEETTNAKKVEEVVAYEAPTTTTTKTTPGIPVYQPTTQPPPTYKQNPNPHPHTFFHDAQAEKVHKGEWPPIYYNSLHGTQRRRRRL